MKFKLIPEGERTHQVQRAKGVIEFTGRASGQTEWLAYEEQREYWKRMGPAS
jgi:hypothetical protein